MIFWHGTGVLSIEMKDGIRKIAKSNFLWEAGFRLLASGEERAVSRILLAARYSLIRVRLFRVFFG